MRKALIPCALLLGACSKVDVYTAAERPQPTPISTQIVQPPPPLVPTRPPSTLERIAEIDKQLAAPLTGKTEDAELRAQLRAERDALTGRFSLTANPSWRVSVPSTPQPPAGRNAATGIIIAPDSQGNSGKSRLGWESLTPSEKKDYLKLNRAARPDILIEDRRDY
jgi:hypothetical protein